MNSQNASLPVHDATGKGTLPVDVVGRTSVELLIGLYATMSPQERQESWAPDLGALPAATRAAVESVGLDAGEVWLHFLGLALESDSTDAAAFVSAVEATAADELRRHLVGVYVPAWRELVGATTLEAAAAGEQAAARRLLDHPRYYGGRAGSLSVLLPLEADETKDRLLATLIAYAEAALAPREQELAVALAAEAGKRAAQAGMATPEQLIESAAPGYQYVREPDVDRVVLIPHFAARPWLLLCQHERARIICYGVRQADGEGDIAGGLLTIGRALSDEKRLAILGRLRQGDATLQELADETGLARSTTHHHLGALRRARLIALRGNASGYAYTLDPTGFAEAERLLGGFLP